MVIMHFAVFKMIINYKGHYGSNFGNLVVSQNQLLNAIASTERGVDPIRSMNPHHKYSSLF